MKENLLLRAKPAGFIAIWLRQTLNRNPYLLVTLMNSVIFVYITGGGILLPQNTEWLRWGDPATAYFGWEFYRLGPLSVWPPGSSPLFGVGYSSSVVYSDSIPLIAIPLKFLLNSYHEPFQYFGLWLYGCFVGQGIAAVRLLKNLAITNELLALLGIVFSLMPAFLYRMAIGGYGHFALTAHFLVLFAMALTLERFKLRSWVFLIGVSILTHAYLLLMVIPFFLVASLRQFNLDKWRQGRYVASFFYQNYVRTFFVMLGVAYISGYFQGDTTLSKSQFGLFGISPLTLFDPSVAFFPSWSKLVPDLPGAWHSYEGFAFIGVGVLTLLFANLRFLNRKTISKIWPILVPSAALLPLAITNQVRLPNRDIVIPVPQLLLDAFGVFRASGRLIWPFMYVLLTVVAFATFKSYQVRKLLTVSIIVCAISIQLLDSGSAHNNLRNRFTDFSTPAKMLRSDRWNEIAGNKSCLVTIPVQFDGEYWHELANFAFLNGMITNASSQARTNVEKIERLSQRLTEVIKSGDIDENCLYLVLRRDSAVTIDLLNSRYRAHGYEKTHVVEAIDDFIAIYTR